MQAFIFLYAILVMVGGWMGYKRANSKQSLAAGLGSGILLLIAGGYSLSNAAGGLLLATLLAFLLIIVFALRFYQTRKFMPSGLMTVISVLAVVLYVTGWILTRQPAG